MKKATFKLANRSGLGSRASTMLVSEANKYQSELCIVYRGERANLKSIMNVLALVIRYQETFLVEVEGSDEEQALLAITALLQTLNLI